MKDRLDKTLLKKIENIFYFLRLCNWTYNKHTYGFLTYIIWYIIAAACWYFFLFCSTSSYPPQFFFSKNVANTIHIVSNISSLFLTFVEKKEAFYVCRLCFQGFHEKKKNNALDFEKCWKLKQNQAKSNSGSEYCGRFFRLRSLSCVHENWALPWCSMKIKYIIWKFLLFFSWRMYEKTKTKV